jgi:hypothetical protein
MPPKTKEEMAELRAMIGKGSAKKAEKKEKKMESESEGEEHKGMQEHLLQIKTLKSEVRKLKKELKGK